MKRTLNLVLAISLFSIALTSCYKDKVAPRFTLLGSKDTTIILQKNFIDPGVIAEDNKDRVITDKVVATVGEVPLADFVWKNQKEGTYVITYTSTDEAGNIATVERYVTIKNRLQDFNRSYYYSRTSQNQSAAQMIGVDCDEITIPRIKTKLKPDNIINNKMTFDNIGNLKQLKYVGNPKIYAYLDSVTTSAGYDSIFTIPATTLLYLDTLAAPDDSIKIIITGLPNSSYISDYRPSFKKLRFKYTINLFKKASTSTNQFPGAPTKSNIITEEWIQFGTESEPLQD